MYIYYFICSNHRTKVVNVTTSNQNSTGWQKYMTKRVIPDLTGRNLQEIVSYAPQAPSKNNIIGAVSTVEG